MTINIEKPRYHKPKYLKPKRRTTGDSTDKKVEKQLEPSTDYIKLPFVMCVKVNRNKLYFTRKLQWIMEMYFDSLMRKYNHTEVRSTSVVTYLKN